MNEDPVITERDRLFYCVLAYLLFVSGAVAFRMSVVTYGAPFEAGLLVFTITSIGTVLLLGLAGFYQKDAMRFQESHDLGGTKRVLWGWGKRTVSILTYRLFCAGWFLIGVLLAPIWESPMWGFVAPPIVMFVFPPYKTSPEQTRPSDAYIVMVFLLMMVLMGVLWDAGWFA